MTPISYPAAIELQRAPWSFYHDDGTLCSDSLELRSDGSIAGYAHPNEQTWRISDGLLEFVSKTGTVSTRFDDFHSSAGTMVLTGRFLLQPELSIVLHLAQREWNSHLPEFTSQTKYSLQAQIDAFDWSIGNHTYGKPRVYAHGPERLFIGNYTSIGEEVTIVLAGHRPDFVSTYPFALFRRHWHSVPDAAFDHRGKGDVRIGSDVWIGHAAFIAPGVQIGNGAIIGAMSVVTQDVPDYAIVAGNTANIKRYRFDPNTIDKLLTIAWWNWTDQRVDAALPFILNDDIEEFIDKVDDGTI